MKVFATALLAATMATTACAKSENGAERLYCVGQNEKDWIFVTLVQNSVKARLQGTFKGPKEDIATLQFLSGACGSSVDDTLDVETGKGGIGRFTQEVEGLAAFEGTSINIVSYDGDDVVCCEWSSANERA